MTTISIPRVEAADTGSVTTCLASDGAVLLTGLPNRHAVISTARSLGRILPHRDSDVDGLTVITDRPTGAGAGLAGFSRAALAPHTDRSGVAAPPSVLMLACRTPAIRGGACVLVDGQAVYRDLAAEVPEAVRDLLTSRTVLFGGAAGYLGSVFEVTEPETLGIRLRLDELVRWSPQAARWRNLLVERIRRHEHVVPLAAGQAYVLNNRRWLHGRRRFAGQRVMYRAILEPRLPIPAGFLGEHDASA